MVTPDRASGHKKDPLGTRMRILAAASEEFAARGPAGARVDEIARVAEVNKRMLYHYFGSKSGLYQATLTNAASELSAAETQTDHNQAAQAPAKDASDPIVVTESRPPDLASFSSQQLRLFAWEGLNSPAASGTNQSGPSELEAELAKTATDLDLQRYLQLALQLAEEIGTPLFALVFGADDGLELKAQQRRLHQQLTDRIAQGSGSSRATVAGKQRIKLRPKSRPPGSR